jgi:hypothetical protein
MVTVHMKNRLRKRTDSKTWYCHIYYTYSTYYIAIQYTKHGTLCGIPCWIRIMIEFLLTGTLSFDGLLRSEAVPGTSEFHQGPCQREELQLKFPRQHTQSYPKTKKIGTICQMSY